MTHYIRTYFAAKDAMRVKIVVQSKHWGCFLGEETRYVAWGKLFGSFQAATRRRERLNAAPCTVFVSRWKLRMIVFDLDHDLFHSNDGFLTGCKEAANGPSSLVAESLIHVEEVASGLVAVVEQLIKITSNPIYPNIDLTNSRGPFQSIMEAATRSFGFKEDTLISPSNFVAEALCTSARLDSTQAQRSSRVAE
ncbi:hypothetical protein AC579_4973 [Pseudocercospora musae]|uniref:Uncharacterized protein n=1 Tax=Pseudocercospora musae TaxID=113226 RepID=A0A139IFZ1_9PEZI|nr:hypothetical protein AC579_4973 [Pseudocercospora musae]